MNAAVGNILDSNDVKSKESCDDRNKVAVTPSPELKRKYFKYVISVDNGEELDNNYIIDGKKHHDANDTMNIQGSNRDTTNGAECGKEGKCDAT